MSDRHEAYMDSEKTFCRRCGAVEGESAWADGVCPGWHPETIEPKPMTPDDTRERLARAACYGDDQLSSGCRCTDEAGCIDWTAYEQVVDAILAEQAAIEREKSDA